LFVWAVDSSLCASVLFLTGNSQDDYRDYEQRKKISLPCWSESNRIRKR